MLFSRSADHLFLAKIEQYYNGLSPRPRYKLPHDLFHAGSQPHYHFIFPLSPSITLHVLPKTSRRRDTSSSTRQCATKANAAPQGADVPSALNSPGRANNIQFDQPIHRRGMFPRLSATRIRCLSLPTLCSSSAISLSLVATSA